MWCILNMGDINCRLSHGGVGELNSSVPIALYFVFMRAWIILYGWNYRDDSHCPSPTANSWNKLTSWSTNGCSAGKLSYFPVEQRHKLDYYWPQVLFYCWTWDSEDEDHSWHGVLVVFTYVTFVDSAVLKLPWCRRSSKVCFSVVLTFVLMLK